jgi:hypothetical protein
MISGSTRKSTSAKPPEPAKPHDRLLQNLMHRIGSLASLWKRRQHEISRIARVPSLLGPLPHLNPPTFRTVWQMLRTGLNTHSPNVASATASRFWVESKRDVQIGRLCSAPAGDRRRHVPPVKSLSSRNERLLCRSFCRFYLTKSEMIPIRCCWRNLFPLRADPGPGE